MSFAACGSVDESSAPAAESSQTTSEAKLENVTIKMDSSKLLYGVEFTDSELLDKITEFRTKVMENAEEKEPDSKEYVVGGDWLDIKCSEGPAIYYESERATMSVSAQRPITQATILPRNLRNMS